MEPLKSDKEKDDVKLAEEINNLAKVKLMNVRASRVVSETRIYEEHVQITRYPTEGVIKRRFNSKEDESPHLFANVYDWVGSVSLDPQYFDIIDFNRNAVLPSTCVYSGVFNMKERENPIVMSPEGEVAFLGYKNQDESALQQKSSTPILAENIKSHSSDLNSATEAYRLLQDKREIEAAKLNNIVINVEVSRDSVYKDLLKIYKKRNVTSHKLHITFKGEDAVEDGVARDAYSAFFSGVYTRMDGCYEKIPSPNFDEADLEIIGKVITHAFIQHNLFPVELSKASLKHYIFGTASEEELLSSFLKFLTSSEVNIITKFRESKTLEDQPILGILNEYSMFHQPTPSNIMSLLAKAVKIALVKLPCFAMQGLTRGMGPFWEKLEENVFDSIYDCTIPTSAKVIESIDAVERSAKDRKVTTWLNRYIRNCSKHRLLLFIRFELFTEYAYKTTIC